MLTSSLGIRLFLMIGKVIPVLAPASLMTAIERVEVRNDPLQSNGFQITFRVSKNLLGEYNLLSLMSPVSLSPYTRVIIGVTLGLTPTVLIDGVITHQQLQPSPQPGQATLTISGTDLTALLDKVELNLVFACMPYSAIAALTLAPYLAYGIVPKVVPSPVMPEDFTPQYDTDLAFLQELASFCNYVFYLEPAAPLVNMAYFGPDLRVAPVLPALTMDMGASDNLLSISFTQDGNAPVLYTTQETIPETSISIPMALPALRIPPLALVPTLPNRRRILRGTGMLDPGQLFGELQNAQRAGLDSVRANGEVDSLRYGSVIRARRLIGVRGAGLAYDGMYWVENVTHVIERDKYTQSFELVREGLYPILPAVLT